MTGAVVLNAGHVGADPVGTAASFMAAHLLDPNPHPQYLTEAEGDSRYATSSSVGIDRGLAADMFNIATFL
jgi:hypothetical protein